MNIADIPYPPIRPQNFMAEVQLAKKGPYVLGGLKVPFMEEAHGTKNVRMWGYEKDTTKDRSAFLHCLTEVLANLAFDNNPLAQVRLHDIVLAAAKAVDQAEPFSLDAMRAPKPNPRANDLVL